MSFQRSGINTFVKIIVFELFAYITKKIKKIKKFAQKKPLLAQQKAK